jgi:hypothetical protein
MSHGSPPPGPIQATIFGMNLVTPLPPGDPTIWPPVPVGSCGKGSFITWPYIEQVQGTYDWRALDTLVAISKSHAIPGQTNSVPLTIALEGAPPWAVSDQSTCHQSYGYTHCTGMPDLTAFDAFMAALVMRYKGQGLAYELYNEPENGFSGTVEDLVTLTAEAGGIIRVNDATAHIGSPSGSAAYMDRYYAAGGANILQGTLNFHLYPDPGTYSSPQYPAAERLIYWTDAYRAVWAKYGLTNFPVWLTEGSWGQALGSMADADQQAAFLARWYLLLWATGVSCGFWYAWLSDTMGVLGAKAQSSWTQVQNWMVGATMPSSPITAGHNAINTDEPAQYACPFTRPGGYQALAIWNTNGPTAYTPDPVYTQYRDLDGNTTAISGPLTIGYKPILLENMTHA